MYRRSWSLLLVWLAVAVAVRAAELPEGFVALFDGKSLEGWQLVGSKKECWQAEKGLLVCTGGGGGWLMSRRQYSDFELRLDYRLQSGANSGVAIRSPLKGRPSTVGMEIQILDDPWYHKNLKGFKPTQQTGAIYGMVPPSKVPSKPAGEWNTMHIRCEGSRVKVVINAQTVVDTDLTTLHDKYAKVNPGILRTAGHIGLQDHGGRLEFRNLMIREIKSN
jgi:hypothetical protein